MTSLARFMVRGLHTSNKWLQPAKPKPILDRIQSFASDIAKRANTVTGYDYIEQIKHQIRESESRIEKLKTTLDDERRQYNESLLRHTAVQRSINDLLHRKHEWKAHDVERVAELYKQDHETEQIVEKAKINAEQGDTNLENERASLSRLIMERYREEQLWSDKIRQFSTWGTMILMGVNLCLFILVQLIIEPWKRRRLIAQFEQRLRADRVVGTTTPPTLEGPVDPLVDQLVDAASDATDAVSQETVNGLLTAAWSTLKAPSDWQTKLRQLGKYAAKLWDFFNTADLHATPIQILGYIVSGTLLGHVVARL